MTQAWQIAELKARVPAMPRLAALLAADLAAVAGNAEATRGILDGLSPRPRDCVQAPLEGFDPLGVLADELGCAQAILADDHDPLKQDAIGVHEHLDRGVAGQGGLYRSLQLVVHSFLRALQAIVRRVRRGRP